MSLHEPIPVASSFEPGPPPAALPVIVLRQLTNLLLSDQSVQSVLQRIAQLASSLPPVTETSLSLVRGHSPSTAAFTGLMAYELDETQYASGHGPCLQAAATGEAVVMTDARAEARWPAFTARARQKGTLSILSVPVLLTVRASPVPVRAALNLYAALPDAFDEDALIAARYFAAHAAVPVSNMMGLDAARQSAEGLVVAMQSRAVIEQAKGILISQFHCSADQAFAELSGRSQRSNRRVRDLAQEMVDQHSRPPS